MRYNRFCKDTQFLTPTTDTQALSEYAAGLRYEDLPAAVAERAKMILLQTVGVSLAANDIPITGKARRMALEANGGSGGTTTLWGTGERLSAVNAALVLGTQSDALDWEDCSWTGHPAAGVIPCAWLAAEERHKSGRELITAIVAGYEVYQRIAMAVQPTGEQWRTKGWGLTSWQIFGAILPIAKLYGFDARRINQAIGMGCECSTLPTSYHAVTMSDFYHYEHGYRARDGFLIAKAVEKGIHNNRDALDEPRCYTGAMCGEDADPSWFTRELGSRYLIMETLLKHWPANMWVQSAVEIVHQLVSAHGFGPEDIETITVNPPVRNRMSLAAEGFDSITHAQFSIPYVVAAMLYHPVPGAHWYDSQTMRDPKVIALAQRVKAGTAPEDSPLKGFKQFQEGGYPMRAITICLKDGTQYTGSMDCHLGHPANMMSQEEFRARFRLQAAPVLQGERLEQALDTLCAIEAVPDIASVSALLCR